MGLETIVEVAALGLAIWAASRSVPRPPALDWERLFKTTLLALGLGEHERQGLTGHPAAQALADLRAALLFNPAGGERPELKLLDPASAPIPVPPHPGERALVEALQKVPEIAPRFQRMYLGDEAAERELLQDPDALGPDYHPSRLGAGLDWAQLGAWSEATQQALARRLGPVILVDLGGDLGALARELTPGLRAASADPTLEPDKLAEHLLSLAPASSDRLALLAAGNAVLPALKAMVASMVLRDRVVAVISVGGRVRDGEGARAWLGAHFTHEALEPELNRAIPFAAVVGVDPRAPVSKEAPDTWENQRFPVPAPSPSGRDAIQCIDLGPLALGSAALAERDLARALSVFLAFRLLD